jgi:hypothetical protein
MDFRSQPETSSLPDACTRSPQRDLPVTTPESALEAELKARLEEIEWQRDEESTAMCYRLHFLVMEYKRRDQSYVDRYTECLDQVLHHFPGLANTRPWAKPCRAAVERQFFSTEGLAIKFYPSTDNRPPPSSPHGDNVTEQEAVTNVKPPSTTTTTATTTAVPQHSSTPTQQQQPSSSIFPASLPAVEVDRRVPCLECRRRKKKCSRDKPQCSQCKLKGNRNPCQYQSLSPPSISSQRRAKKKKTSES